MGEKGAPKEMGIVNQCGAKRFALRGNKITLLISKQTEIRRADTSKVSGVNLKSISQKTMKRFAVQIEPLVKWAVIMPLATKDQRGMMRNGKGGRLKDSRREQVKHGGGLARVRKA